MWCFLHPLLSFIVFLHHHSCFLHRTTINLWLFPTMASFQHVGYSITPCHHSYPELLSSGFVHFAQCISVAVWWLKVQLLFAAPPLFISGSSQIQQSERQGIVRSSCCLWWGLLDFILIFNFFFDCVFLSCISLDALWLWYCLRLLCSSWSRVCHFVLVSFAWWWFGFVCFSIILIFNLYFLFVCLCFDCCFCVFVFIVIAAFCLRLPSSLTNSAWHHVILKYGACSFSLVHLAFFCLRFYSPRFFDKEAF